MQAIMEARQPQSGRSPVTAGKVKTGKHQSHTTYHEEMHKGTLYRVTNVHLDKVDLGRALEDLTVRKIVMMENTAIQTER